MEYMDGTKVELLRKRDLANFVQLRTARPGDDPAVGELLVRSFRETNAQKLPGIPDVPEREKELRDVGRRRRKGIVRVMELGFQIIGTYSLLSPGEENEDAWLPGHATLRCLALDPHFHSLKLSEQMLLDALALARNWSSTGLCLHVQSGAAGVARLYQNFGFKRDFAGDKIISTGAIEGYRICLVDA